MHREGKFFAVEKNYSTVKKKQKRGHVIYMMATFLMVKKKEKENYPVTGESVKRIGNDK